jgi:hypothetical protein
MTHIGREHDNSFVRRMGRFAVSALMYALLPAGLWSGIGWAQRPLLKKASHTACCKLK